MYSRGAIIFTNDGEFAAKLSHPSAEIEKEYNERGVSWQVYAIMHLCKTYSL